MSNWYKRSCAGLNSSHVILSQLCEEQLLM